MAQCTTFYHIAKIYIKGWIVRLEKSLGNNTDSAELSWCRASQHNWYPAHTVDKSGMETCITVGKCSIKLIEVCLISDYHMKWKNVYSRMKSRSYGWMMREEYQIVFHLIKSYLRKNLYFRKVESKTFLTWILKNLIQIWAIRDRKPNICQFNNFLCKWIHKSVLSKTTKCKYARKVHKSSTWFREDPHVLWTLPQAKFY